MGNVWCRVRVCGMAYSQLGCIAAIAYVFRRRWAVSPHRRASLFAQLNECVRAFEVHDVSPPPSLPQLQPPQPPVSIPAAVDAAAASSSSRVALRSSSELRHCAEVERMLRCDGARTAADDGCHGAGNASSRTHNHRWTEHMPCAVTVHTNLRTMRVYLPREPLCAMFASPCPRVAQVVH